MNRTAKLVVVPLALCAAALVACGIEPVGPDDPAAGLAAAVGDVQQLRCCNLYAQIGPNGERIQGAVPYPSQEGLALQTTSNWMQFTLAQPGDGGILGTVLGGAGARSPLIQGSGEQGSAALDHGFFNLISGISGEFEGRSVGTVTASWQGGLNWLILEARERRWQGGALLRSGYGLTECRPVGGWGEPTDAGYDWFNDGGFEHCIQRWWPSQLNGVTDAHAVCQRLHETWPQ